MIVKVCNYLHSKKDYKQQTKEVHLWITTKNFSIDDLFQLTFVFLVRIDIKFFVCEKIKINACLYFQIIHSTYRQLLLIVLCMSIEF